MDISTNTVSLETFSCYDYANQKWITGAEAVTLRIKQLNEDLDLFEGERGEEYARFVAIDRAKAMRGICAELERLGDLRFRAGYGESGLSYR